MLAHAASAQGISAVENMCGRPHVLNHASVPAACFTHPEVPLVLVWSTVTTSLSPLRLRDFCSSQGGAWLFC